MIRPLNTLKELVKSILETLIRGNFWQADALPRNRYVANRA